MVPVLLALAAAAAWGAADFGGGLFTRRFAPLVVLFVIEAGGLATALIVLLVSGDAWPGTGIVVAALGAGCLGVAGLGLFYRGLAVGTMSIVAPLAATGAVLPVALGLATGDPLSVLLGVGLTVALAGVVLASREGRGDTVDATVHRRSVVLGLAAAVCFGAFFAVYDHVADAAIGWSIVLTRVPAVPLLGTALWVQRRRGTLGVLPAGAPLGRLLVIAQLDCIATSLYAVAITRGALSVVVVVGSLYPVVTVLLARVVLGERLVRTQAIGVVAALAGVALIGLGTG